MMANQGFRIRRLSDSHTQLSTITRIRVLAGQGASIDTTTASGKFVFALFAALAEFERELIRERTLAGLASARARGRKGGRPHALSKAQVRLAQAAMAQRDTKVSELCLALGMVLSS